jgi:2-methylcitrate dehydratase PrpD
MQGAAPAIDYSGMLADYAAGLRYEDIPETALRAARQCLVDAVGCAVFGSRFPWSHIIRDTAVLPPGTVAVPGSTITADAAKAAYLASAFAHAFELDSLRKPGAGVHPGATVALPALAVAQEIGASGKVLLAAIVAGCEVMFRIGAATLHTAEKQGFHAPGITGVFGSAVASAHLLGLSPQEMRHALGLSGSMTGGLLAFAASGTGGMVKRLHLGRAAESGVSAARLAAGGYEGPAHILEGTFGVLQTFCERHDVALLSDGLGTRYEIETLCIKRYACHVTAQAPIEMLSGWRLERGFWAGDIVSIALDVPPKIASHHAGKHPADMALAQYSVPFMLAFAAVRGLDDPAALTEAAIVDPAVHALADRILITADESLKGWAMRMRLTLADGSVLAGEPRSFAGTPERALSDDQLADRFRKLTADRAPRRMQDLLAGLLEIDALDDVRKLPLGDSAQH